MKATMKGVVEGIPGRNGRPLIFVFGVFDVVMAVTGENINNLLSKSFILCTYKNFSFYVYKYFN